MYDWVVRECSLEEVFDLKTKWHRGSLLKAKCPEWREQQMQKNGNRARLVYLRDRRAASLTGNRL